MEDNGIVYDNPRNFVKGTWHGEWFDRPQDGIKKASEVYQKEQGEKLIQIHRNYMNDIQNKKTEDAIQRHLSETEEMDDSVPDKKILLN
jgi:CHASE3 domain sensor protein